MGQSCWRSVAQTSGGIQPFPRKTKEGPELSLVSWRTRIMNCFDLLRISSDAVNTHNVTQHSHFCLKQSQLCQIDHQALTTADYQHLFNQRKMLINSI